MLASVGVDCGRRVRGAHPTLVGDLRALLAPLDELSFPAAPGSEPTAGEKLAIAEQIPELYDRVDSVLTSTGGAYPNAMRASAEVYEILELAEAALQPDPVDGFGSEIDAGRTLDDLIDDYDRASAQQ